ncbi:MAG: hypothetical protein AAF927_14970 [Bacteroidota bacterium]
MKTTYYLARKSFILLLVSALAFSINACDQINLEDCFEPLNGTWVRVKSSDPSSDCMKVVISGEVAVLFANPKNVSWVDEGDNLWQGITHVKALQEYEMQVLGSDGNYYDAVLKLTDPNTINIAIDTGGSSTEQEWVRVGASDVIPECEVSDINGNWTRIESSNSSLDGMRIKIVDEEAVVTFLPDGAPLFSIGSVAWQKIKAIPGGDQFSLEVYGSDHNYHEATLKRIDDNRMELTVTLFGIRQIWER